MTNKKLHDVFTTLLNNMPAAKLTDDVRYYLTDEENSITYGQFKNHTEPIKK